MNSSICSIVTKPIIINKFTISCISADPNLATGPAGPAGPVAPVGPCSPLIPCIPFGPVSPIGPVAPVAPSLPAGPVAPIGDCGQSHIPTKVSTVLDTILLVLVPVSREYE